MGGNARGPSRTMGAIVEVHHDKNGIIWPKEVAPYKVHLVEVKSQKPKVKNSAEKIYQDLQKQGIEVIYDDRKKSAGEKFADADLIGLPIRIVVSEKTLSKNCLEIKTRAKKKGRLVKIKELPRFLKYV
jgi:prolyl-tRNA synthetase